MTEPTPEPDTSTATYSQSWQYQGRKLIPVFYHRSNGRLRRVTEKEGIKLIESGEGALTDSLRKYFAEKGVVVKERQHTV